MWPMPIGRPRHSTLSSTSIGLRISPTRSAFWRSMAILQRRRRSRRPDVKDVDAGLLGHMLERAAHLNGEMRNGDRGKRGGAFDDQEIARAQAAKRLAGPQNGQRALQAFEIEMHAVHG